MQNLSRNFGDDRLRCRIRALGSRFLNSRELSKVLENLRKECLDFCGRLRLKLRIFPREDLMSLPCPLDTVQQTMVELRLGRSCQTKNNNSMTCRYVDAVLMVGETTLETIRL